MGELIFFAIIILFSILEAIAKRRKEAGEGGEEAAPGEVTPGERRPAPKRERPPGRRPERGPASRSDRRPTRREEVRREAPTREEPSETMIPADIWEEIAGLTTGRPPRPRPRAEVEDQAEEARSLEKLDVERFEEDETRRSVRTYTGERIPSSADAHPVHRSHAGYGTDPSERLPSEQDWRPRAVGNPNGKRVRAMLRGSEGTDALKQAVILQEVLGPPAGMKDR